MDEKRYYRLGATRGKHLPKVGEEYCYMGIFYKVVDIEETDQTVGCTDADGHHHLEPMVYIVMVPVRPSPEFEVFNPGEFDRWKGEYFPEYPESDPAPESSG